MIEGVLVHLDGSLEDEIRLEDGQSIASAGHSRLIRSLTNRLPDLTITRPVDGGAAALRVLAEPVKVDADHARGDNRSTPKGSLNAWC